MLLFPLCPPRPQRQTYHPNPPASRRAPTEPAASPPSSASSASSSTMAGSSPPPCASAASPTPTTPSAGSAPSTSGGSWRASPPACIVPRRSKPGCSTAPPIRTRHLAGQSARHRCPHPVPPGSQPEVRPDPRLASLPTPEQIAAEVRRRPVGAVIADICCDLGIRPDHPLWRELQLAIILYDGNLVRFYKAAWRRTDAALGVHLDAPASPPASASPQSGEPVSTGPP